MIATTILASWALFGLMDGALSRARLWGNVRTDAEASISRLSHRLRNVVDVFSPCIGALGICIYVAPR